MPMRTATYGTAAPIMRCVNVAAGIAAGAWVGVAVMDILIWADVPSIASSGRSRDKIIEHKGP